MKIILLFALFCSLYAENSFSAEVDCDQHKGIVHNDGRYKFEHKSWVDEGNEKTFYRRCISSIEPTEIRAEWVGVVPSGIAREGDPLTSGSEFPTREDTFGASDLYYGNSDDVKEDAYFVAHAIESGGQQWIVSKGIDISEYVMEQIQDKGKAELRSEASFTVKDEGISSEDYQNIDLVLTSVADSKNSVEYEFEFNVESETPLYLSFPDTYMTEIVSSNTGDFLLSIQPGRSQIDLSSYVSGDIYYYVKAYAILRSADRETNLSYIPFSYMVDR